MGRPVHGATGSWGDRFRERRASQPAGLPGLRKHLNKVPQTVDQYRHAFCMTPKENGSYQACFVQNFTTSASYHGMPSGMH